MPVKQLPQSPTTPDHQPPYASLPSDIGGKAANLQSLQAAGFDVPPFVVSPDNLSATVARLGTPLVVRSSATGEDGDAVSFAGQFESYLNLNTLEQVAQAVERCHDSVRQPSVADYCRKHAVPFDQLKMHVIVQRMIEPELAGVVFTVNPTTGSDQMVIEACEGTADALLSGQQSPLPADHPLLRKHRRGIESLARRIQRHFGTPQDIEFAIAEDRIWVLQARPITRITFSSEAGEWTTADFRDGGVSSTVCSPLMWSLYESIWDCSLKDTLRQLRLWKHDFQAAKMFFGRPYWNLAALKDCLAQLPGYKEREFDDDLSIQVNYTGDGKVTPVTVGRVLRAIPTVLAVKRFLRSQKQAAEALLDSADSGSFSPWHDMPRTEHSFRQLIEQVYAEVEYTYFRTIFAASLAKLDFVSSFPNADCGALVAGLPPLRHMAPVRAVQSLPQRTPESIAEVTNTYRHHYRNGLDVIFPRWDEDQTFVHNMLVDLPDSGGRNPIQAYHTAYAETLQQTPRWKRRTFERKLATLRHFLWLREELRDVSSQIYYHIRQHALELGHQRDLGDSIFFQTFQDIFADRRDHIETNREIYDSYRCFPAPNEIGGPAPADVPSAAGDLRGIGVSPGTCTATAFLAKNVEQAANMPRGQILVCPFTDPGWTAVLDRAAGVVTETGGMLSHAAILCREYGIPAVLNVRNAMTTIAAGEMILIDGGRGRVEPLNQREA
ncbi:PEP/pyruvate-binding domain-containing protein [Roseimaritima ulvae]|uniref:Chondramide synthase cmdD n=1 Tax=Roseimaritima ulvae TaxID=980254 RepID=A0A5B9QW60_9BACT|nr:PEP/pyruvate-binding domain-containing protein [Roseimaritima ulvae]QEG38251.1 Chondramide synthase cmdD [Roseimaritima ulvae]